MIRILFKSEDCVNFLSPAAFLCPLSDCKGKPPIWLRSFNNISSVEDHFINHKTKDSISTFASVLIARYQFLTRGNFMEDNSRLTITEAPEKLYNDTFLPNASMRFRGKHHYVREINKFKY